MPITIDPDHHPEVSAETQTLTEEDVDDIFEAVEEKENPHQGDYLRRLYAAAFGFDVLADDAIEKIDGYPTICEDLWEHICDRARRFDEEHHDCMAGGLWMSAGFSTGDVPPATVELPPLKVEAQLLPEMA
jgi:hypothetical protein